MTVYVPELGHLQAQLQTQGDRLREQERRTGDSIALIDRALAEFEGRCDACGADGARPCGDERLCDRCCLEIHSPEECGCGRRKPRDREMCERCDAEDAHHHGMPWPSTDGDRRGDH